MTKVNEAILIPTEVRKYRITGVTEILGSLAPQKNIYEEFIASKAPAKELTEQELALFPDNEKEVEEEKVKTTIFNRNEKGEICLLDYQIKGYLKSACLYLAAYNGIAQAKSKIDRYVSINDVYNRLIPLTRDGKPITEPDGKYERPIQCETMKGPRVSLASSEMIAPPYQAEFSIELMKNPSSKSSKSVTFDAIEQALNLGTKTGGLLQFRNGGYGRFTWERID